MREKVVLEQITWRLDKLENDTLPQVDLNVTEVGALRTYALYTRGGVTGSAHIVQQEVPA